jgi:hypothetical protein
LTYAFYKWPGAFDAVMGGLKALIAIGLAPFTLVLSGLMVGLGKLIGLTNKEWGQSLQDGAAKLVELNMKLGENGIAQAKAGVEAVKTQKATESHTNAVHGHTDALNKDLVAVSERNKALQETQQVYAGLEIGTRKEREALLAQAQGRDKELKDFEQWLEAKSRLAVSKEGEQQEKLLAAKMKAMGTTGGPEEKKLGAEDTIALEQNKQEQLAAMWQVGALTYEQWNEAKLASDMRARAAQLQIETAYAQAKGDVLGDSDAGFQYKLQKEQEHFDLELQNKLAQAELAGATDAEIQSLTEQQELDHKGRMAEIGSQFYEKKAEMDEKAGNDWQASLDKVQAAFEKHHSSLEAIQALSQTKQYQGLMGMLSNMSSLRSSKSKTMFEIGKKAAIAEATINTFKSATLAFSALAGIPLIGPVLGAAAAAAAIAAGFTQIQGIEAQKFNGGQAHGGIDNIPTSMSDKTFLLSGGERVVQPEANKDLTNYLDKQNGSGSSGGGAQYNITLHYNGSGSTEDARSMAEMVVKEIRRMSERGTPIMSEKGLIKA